MQYSCDRRKKFAIVAQSGRIPFGASTAMTEPSESTTLDHSSDDRFTSYYERQSMTPGAVGHSNRVRDALLRLLSATGHRTEQLEVLDIGCNTGTLSNAWAELGHRVHALDINEPLLEIARQRSAEAGFDVDYKLGTAADLPWPDESMDVAVAMELLEHVEDWEGVVHEMMRVLKPGGVMFLTTTNYLCPIQSEYNLPLYSWYPGFLKKRIVKLTKTTRPQLANYATYPALHWFTFYSLRRYGRRHGGFKSFDRFDLAASAENSGLKQAVLTTITRVPPLRLLGHVIRNGTAWAAVKQDSRAT